jgi:hypothetical protein
VYSGSGRTTFGVAALLSHEQFGSEVDLASFCIPYIVEVKKEDLA